MKNLIFITFLVISNSMFSQGFINMTAAGSWSKTIAPTDIIEAGNDYQTFFESGVSQTLLSIYPNNKNNQVYVYVTRNNDNWHDNLILKVKRNGSGTNTHRNINGGIIYHLITNSQPPSGRPSAVMPFFTCYDDFINIPLQYEITGLSVVLPVKSYSTTITYTVMY